jgi:hypothetical protein
MAWAAAAALAEPANITADVGAGTLLSGCYWFARNWQHCPWTTPCSRRSLLKGVLRRTLSWPLAIPAASNLTDTQPTTTGLLPTYAMHQILRYVHCCLTRPISLPAGMLPVCLLFLISSTCTQQVCVVPSNQPCRTYIQACNQHWLHAGQITIAYA